MCGYLRLTGELGFPDVLEVKLFILDYWKAREEKEGYQDRRVETITIHPKWDSESYYMDLAILKLKTSLEFTAYVQPACLPPRGFRIPEGKKY